MKQSNTEESSDENEEEAFENYGIDELQVYF